MAKPDRTVLIVGAGPTGLTAATELARGGVRCRVADRDDGPTPLSKAVGISPHTLDLLEPSGVAGRLLQDGLKVRRFQAHSGPRPLGSLTFSALRHRHNYLLSLPQSDIETRMAEVLSDLGVAVEWRTTVSHVRQTAAGVEATLSGPAGDEVVAVDHLFGADGAESQVRQDAGIAFEGYVHRRLWSIADTEIPDWPHPGDEAQIYFHDGGDVGFIIPIGGGRFRAVSNTPDAMARIPGRYSVARTLRTDRFHIPAQLAATYQAGRIALGGDAAHVHSPLGARGMNLGIEDAVCYARRLAGGDLAGYSDERRPVARDWVRLSERLLGAVQARAPLAVAARNLAIAVVTHAAWLQRPILNRVAGLTE